MKSRPIKVIISVFSIFIIFSTVNLYCQETKIRIIKEDAVLRLKPNSESLIIKKLPLGAVLSVEESIRDWVKIKLPPDKDGVVVTGYIHRSFVEFEIKPSQIKPDIEPVSTELKKEIKLLILLSTPVYADDILGIYKKLKNKLPDKDSSLYGEWVNQFKDTGKFIKFLKDKDKEGKLQKLDLSVDAGFNGHKAGENSLYKLDIGAQIIKGIYPREFRFKAGTSVQFKDEKLQEDVTTILINYDYHFRPWLEIYGFVERFSDSFLSIQQRYEIGGGIKLEMELFGTTKKEIDEKLKTYGKNSKVYEQYRCYLNKRLTNTNSLYKQLEDLEEQEEFIVQSLRKKYAKLAIGLHFTLFSELEQAKIETYADEIVKENGISNIKKVTESTMFSLDGEQRFRFVLGPSVIFRPWDTFSLQGLIYRKYPFISPYKKEGRLDYRCDTVLRAKLDLPKVPNFEGTVSVIFEYQRHYDNIPPQLPKSVIDEYFADGKVLRKTAAEDTHEEFKFKLQIQF